MKCILALLIILLTIPACSADLGVGDVVSGWFADGADTWMTRTADQIMCGNQTNSSVANAIIGFSSWSVTPFEYPTILNMMGVSLCFGIGFLIMYIFLGATYVNISKMKSDKYKSFAHIIGAGRRYNELEDYAKNVMIGCISMSFIVIFIFMVLLFGDVLKGMVMISIADAISPSMDVPILYFFMAIQWLVLALFFGISNVVICITAGTSFILGALYASDRTRHITEGWLDYFGGMVLMQVLVVGITVIVVGVLMDIKAKNQFLTMYPQIEMSTYLGLMVLMVLMCGGFTIGYFRIIKTSKQIIKMVA